MTAMITAVHLACLSMLESGDNDRAVGASGEVTRWQIMPRLYTGQNPANQTEARRVVFTEWERRAEAFTRHHHQLPTCRQLYLLWACPSRVEHPQRAKLERATRFENLCKISKP